MKKILLLALMVLVYQGQSKAGLPATITGFQFGYLVSKALEERNQQYQYPLIVSVALGIAGSGIIGIAGPLIFPDHTIEFYEGSMLGIGLAIYHDYEEGLLLQGQIPLGQIPLAQMPPGQNPYNMPR